MYIFVPEVTYFNGTDLHEVLSVLTATERQKKTNIPRAFSHHPHLELQKAEQRDQLKRAAYMRQKTWQPGTASITGVFPTGSGRSPQRAAWVGGPGRAEAAR